MHFQEIKFLGSFERISNCPTLNLPEYAFIGRSNVGKSSLINMLLDRKEVARTSKRPGKTQTINLFEIEKEWIIADLPGYGYAKVSKSMRKKWEGALERYLMMRDDLLCTFVLIDLRHPLQQNDLEFINWLGEIRVPFSIIYTKSDKVKPALLDEHVMNIRNVLLEHWAELPRDFVSSAEDRTGREEVLNFIQELNANFVQEAKHAE